MPDVAKLPPLFSGSTRIRIDSLNDVVALLSSSRHDGTSGFWWRVKASGEVLFGNFDNQSPSHDQRLRVLLFASNCPSRAARITNNLITSTEWILPMQPPFTVPLELNYIDQRQLRTVERLANNIEVVIYNGRRYIHNYMDYFSHPSSFEYEIMFHRRIHSTRLVPTLVSVVIYEGKNRGLLFEYLDGIPPNEEMKEPPQDFPLLMPSLVYTCCLGGPFETVTEEEVYWSALRAMVDGSSTRA